MAAAGPATRTAAQALAQLTTIVGGRRVVPVEDFARAGVWEYNTKQERKAFADQFNPILRRILIPQPDWYPIPEKIYPWQEDVIPRFVVPFIENPDLAETFEEGPNYPHILLGDGQHWISDGHHRIVAYKLLGIQRCKMQFNDLDEDEGYYR